MRQQWHGRASREGLQTASLERHECGSVERRPCAVREEGRQDETERAGVASLGGRCVVVSLPLSAVSQQDGH